MITKGEHYALKVSGDSMINKGMNDNDIAIIRKTKRSRKWRYSGCTNR